MNCLSTAWKNNESELRGWLRHRLGNHEQAEDLVQDLFVKALHQGEHFCQLQNPRAWLFEVARNTLTDHVRRHRELTELPDDLPHTTEQVDTVDTLTHCLARVLTELDADDREVISLCDLQGMAQAEFAKHKSLNLSTAKSRLQRARQRLRAHMTLVCQVKHDDSGCVSDFVPR
jgi:RNA polymerase sigma-70 factor (ECF subfamily)